MLRKLLIVVFGVVSFPFVVMSESPIQIGNETIHYVATGDAILSDGVSAGDNFMLVWGQKSETDAFLPKGKLITGDGVMGEVISTGTLPLNSLPVVAYGGDRFLTIWSIADGEEHSVLYGQFMTSTGTLDGEAFIISTGTGIKQVRDIAYADGQFLVVWVDERSGTKDVYGRLVGSNGTMTGGELAIATGLYNQKDASVTSDGSTFLVVWNDGARLGQGYGEDVIGRIVSASGSLGNSITISQNGIPSDNPVNLVFDGERYFVVWMEEVGGATSGEWDIYGRFVSPDGSLIGSEITISDESGGQMFPFVAYKDSMYVVVWTDMRNDLNGNFVFDEGEGTGSDIYGQCIDMSGALVGTEFVITAAPNDQVGGSVNTCTNGFRSFWIDNVAGVHDVFQLPYGDINGVDLTIDDASNVEEHSFPDGYSLKQNRPNPFNPRTTIEFAIPVSENVRLEVYTISGQKVATLLNGRLEAGTHSVVFDGDGLPTGIYSYLLETSQFTDSGTMLLLK